MAAGWPDFAPPSTWVHSCTRAPAAIRENRAGAAGLLRPVRDRSGPGPSAERLHRGDRCRPRLAGTLIGPDGVSGIRATKAQDVKTDRASDAVAIPPWSANADRQQLTTTPQSAP